MSRAAISGSPDLVSGRSNEGGKKAVDTKEGVSTITTTAVLQLSCTTRASNTELKRIDAATTTSTKNIASSTSGLKSKSGLSKAAAPSIVHYKRRTSPPSSNLYVTSSVQTPPSPNASKSNPNAQLRESVAIISKGDHHGQILQQYGVHYQCGEEDNATTFDSSTADVNPNFTDCGLPGVAASSSRVQAICSIGGSKKQVHILQKSPMFVTSSSSGKGEGKNQSLLANGPLTIEGLTQIESSSGASGSTKGGAYFIKPASKQYSSSMQQPQQKKSPTGGTSTSSFHQSQLPSNEELNSRCGSRQSLLDSTSHRSHLSVAAAAHQYSNAGCTSNVVPSSGAEENMPNRNNQHPSPASSNQCQQTLSTKGIGNNSSNSDMRKQRVAMKKDLQQKLNHWDKDKEKSRYHWSFVFDPAGRLCYYWSLVVSIAFLYNFWVIIFRFSFAEIDRDSILYWFCLDYFMDLIYILDVLFHFRTGYLEDGVLQTDSTKLRQHYMNSTTFYVDCLCLLPLDFLYLSLGYKSILRIFRLVKVYQFWAFMDRTERHTNYPNLFRFFSLIHYLLVAFHWNSCVFHLLHYDKGFGGAVCKANDIMASSALSSMKTSSSCDSAWHPKNYLKISRGCCNQEDCDSIANQKNGNKVITSSCAAARDSVMTYLVSYYWTILSMTTIGDLPRPGTKTEYLYVIFELVLGLITFATVLGYIANIVTNVSAARKDFQAKLDGVKTYMRIRRVPKNIQNKVIKWFDYLWLTQNSSDEERAIQCLPDKLKGEIAIHVHLDTLKRVEIFQNTEAGFLCELVLSLKPVLFSPGDYICRKGEVGKEMYICTRGRLEVVADDAGKTVLATLKSGSYFGEISILNMGTAGNRRTASVRSVGYSDLFVLSKKDMWDVLKDYPAARVRLEAVAVKRLEKYKRAPLDKAALPRSTSTPGLIESAGKIPLEDMWVSPMPLHSPDHSTSPASMLRNRRQTTSDSPPLSELSTRSQSTAETGGQHHNQQIKTNAAVSYAAVQKGSCYLTQTPSTSNHHHSHHKEHKQQQQQHHQSYLNQQQQHHHQIHKNTHNVEMSRRNSSTAALATGQQQQHGQQQLHLDPLNAVALPDNGILTVSQQMHQPALSQQQPIFTSSAMTGGGNYQPHSLLHGNFISNERGTRLSTVYKQSHGQNMSSNLQHTSGDINMKGNASMVHPSSPTIPRIPNVSSSLVWSPQTISMGSESAFTVQGGNVLQQHPPSHQQSTRHQFQQQQQPYTIVDPQLGTSQSQRIPISQSPHNLLYNPQNRNSNIPFSHALARSGPVPNQLGIVTTTVANTAVQVFGSQQEQTDQQQILEIRWLRDRIKMLETDNASMNLKLSTNQKDINQRLNEIEMQMCPEDTFEDDEDEGGIMGDEETSVFSAEHLIGPSGTVQSLTGSGSSSGNGDNGIQISSTNSNLVSMVMTNKRHSGSYEEEDEKNRESFI